jgi:ATP-binding protein involved in chromosome partitioning
MPLPLHPQHAATPAARANPAPRDDEAARGREHITQEQERLARILTGFGTRIGVHSGKGGVGKSLVAVALARALVDEGEHVGLLDADIDCPNVPHFLGNHARVTVRDDERLEPIRVAGLTVMSSGYLQEPDQPLIIRGPIKHRLLTDFIERTAWGPLDTLVVDLPPGTSDVPLSAMQFLALHGLIVVTTPTTASLGDAHRAIAMANTLHVPVVGVVVNMDGGAFGTVTDERIAELGAPLLARIPLDHAIAAAADRGDDPLRGYADTRRALVEATRRHADD